MSYSDGHPYPEIPRGQRMLLPMYVTLPVLWAGCALTAIFSQLWFMLFCVPWLIATPYAVIRAWRAFRRHDRLADQWSRDMHAYYDRAMP